MEHHEVPTITLQHPAIPSAWNVSSNKGLKTDWKGKSKEIWPNTDNKDQQGATKKLKLKTFSHDHRCNMAQQSNYNWHWMDLDGIGINGSMQMHVESRRRHTHPHINLNINRWMILTGMCTFPKFRRSYSSTCLRWHQHKKSNRAECNRQQHAC